MVVARVWLERAGQREMTCAGDVHVLVSASHCLGKLDKYTPVDATVTKPI